MSMIDPNAKDMLRNYKKFYLAELQANVSAAIDVAVFIEGNTGSELLVKLQQIQEIIKDCLEIEVN